MASCQLPAAWGLSASRLLGLSGLIGETAAAPITATAVQALRRQQGQAVAAMVIAIASEQRRAVEKLGPGTWMVSAQGIRQATDRVVAAYKARLLAGRPVFDLCGGIGGDALELARRAVVATIDYDPQLTAMAAANLRLDCLTDPSRSGRTAGAASMAGDAIAICADVTRYPIPKGVAVHIDPDRRPQQRRTIRPSDYLPSLEFVAGLVSGSEAAVVKLAPAAALERDTHGLGLSQLHHRQWISLDSSVREQTLLCGDAIGAAGVAAGGRSAVRLMRDGTLQRFSIDSPTAARLEQLDRLVQVSGVPPGVIIDFDPAVRGAGLSAALAIDRGLAALGGPAGFFCSDTLPEERSLMQCFETLWSGSADRKQIKRELRRRDWVLQSVKVRGSEHDPAELQRTLQPDKPQAQRSRIGAPSQGSADPKAELSATIPVPVSLLIGRHRRGVYAVIARKIPQ